MSSYGFKKNKIARKYGVNIFNRRRNPLLHKQNPPGSTGQRRRKKSEYGLQLNEKQKLKAVYGMLSESQLLKYYKKVVNLHGNTNELLLQQLESRLDVVVFNLKLASTIFAAHQLVSHGHILVDGKKVNIRSFQVKPGMTISLKPKSKKKELVVQSLEDTRDVPSYLEIQPEQLSGRFITYPEIAQISHPVEINISDICELLAHTH
ncbi:30S ribosomal protein S4 [Chlamydiia bacterium]|jgi:small subunit ribosomal protein S4|nr:30S ribosomal protein S4 [Chlamydiia bacterium]